MAGQKTACPRVAALTGGARSGKTAALAEHVAELLAQGVAASDVLVLTPGADGARALGERLAARLAGTALGVAVRSLRAVELEALRGAPAAAGVQGAADAALAAPRVALEVEEALVEADLHAAGFSPDAIKAARADLAAAWAAGEDGEGAVADAAAGDVARAMLAAYGARGLVPLDALASWALGRVRADEGLAARLGAAYVLVDDANAASPAAVALACALAGRECIMAGDPSWAPTLFDRGACADAFVRVAETVEALPPAARMVAAGRSYAVKWAHSQDELAGCQTYVERLFAKLETQAGTVGLTEHDQRTRDDLLALKGGDVYVVVPNRMWAGAFAARLAERGIFSTTLLAHRPLAGDPGKARANAGMRAYALLALTVRPDDAGAWRLWCAFDAPDRGCRAWAALERHAAAAGMSPVEALATLAGDAFEGADALAKGYAAGCACVDAARRKRGHAVRKAVDAQATTAFAELCAPMMGDETPAELFARVCDRAVDRQFDTDPHKVRIGCAEAFVGLEARYVLALGCNEGLVSQADCPADLHAFALASDELAVSYLQRCPVEQARKLGAATVRTRTEDGVAMAQLRPSPCLALLGSEIPSTLSGQQFCSCVLDMRL